MINKEISQQVLTISPNKNGKGGIASVVSSISVYYEGFNYIITSNGSSIFSKIGYLISSISQLLYYILVKKIKIVHIHGASRNSFYRKSIYVNICHFFKTKIVYHSHGGNFELFYEQLKKQGRASIIKNTLDKADVLVVLTNNWKKFYSTITDENKIIVLNNIVIPPKEIQKKRYSEAPLSFLFLGDIRDKKGIFDLIEVIAANKDKLKGKIHLYVGGREEVRRLETAIKQNELQDIVSFEGWVAGDKKEELFFKSDIYILPSYIEGLPVSILEAMSYGMPIISTNVGGIPELITSGENGILFDAGNKPELLNAINYFLNNPQEVQRMGILNKEKATAYYPDQVIPQLEKIYIDLAAR